MSNWDGENWKKPEGHRKDLASVEYRGSFGTIPYDRATRNPLCPKCGGETDQAGEHCLSCLLG